MPEPGRAYYLREEAIPRALIIVAVLSALLLSCSGPRSVGRFPAAEVEPAAAVDSVLARESRVGSIMGKISVEAITPGREVDFSADFFFSPPDSFRANIRGLLGTTPGALVALDDSTVAYFPGRDTVYVAVSDTSAENPVLGLNFSLPDLVCALAGYSGISGADSGLAASVSGEGIYEVNFFAEGQINRLEILPQAWIPRSRQIYSPQGDAVLDIDYSDFVERGDRVRPSIIIVTNPLRGEKVTIEIEKEYFGRELPEDVFRLPLPETTVIWRLI